MARRCPQVGVLSVGSTSVISVSLDDWLDSGESLSGTQSVSEVTTSDLTITNLAETPGVATITTATMTIRGKSVAAGRALQFVVTGHQDNTSYVVLVTARTNSTPVRVEPFEVAFNVT